MDASVPSLSDSLPFPVERAFSQNHEQDRLVEIGVVLIVRPFVAAVEQKPRLFCFHEDTKSGVVLNLARTRSRLIVHRAPAQTKG